MTTRSFTRGQLVRWRAHGNGSNVHHTGVIVLCIPGGVPLSPILASLQDRYNTRSIVGNGPRQEESYLVARTGGRGKAKLHWPHATSLLPYEQPCHAPDKTPPLVG